MRLARDVVPLNIGAEWKLANRPAVLPGTYGWMEGLKLRGVRTAKACIYSNMYQFATGRRFTEFSRGRNFCASVAVSLENSPKNLATGEGATVVTVRFRSEMRWLSLRNDASRNHALLPSGHFARGRPSEASRAVGYMEMTRLIWVIVNTP